jgi:hypothetical protein
MRRTQKLPVCQVRMPHRLGGSERNGGIIAKRTETELCCRINKDKVEWAAASYARLANSSSGK